MTHINTVITLTELELVSLRTILDVAKEHVFASILNDLKSEMSGQDDEDALDLASNFGLMAHDVKSLMAKLTDVVKKGTP